MSVVALAPLTITTTPLPGGTQNAAYNQTIDAGGGMPPYTFSLASGSLPTGISITTTKAQGAISGTPTAVGSSSFTVQVNDSSSPQLTATQPYTVTVSAPPGDLQPERGYPRWRHG